MHLSPLTGRDAGHERQPAIELEPAEAADRLLAELASWGVHTGRSS
jgi:hypothetical protein